MQEWVDICVARVLAEIGVPPCYYPRDNPVGDDFIETDLTIDGDWHELDLSAIVPAGMKAVVMHIRGSSTDLQDVIYLRQHGYTHSFGTCSLRIVVVNLDAGVHRTIGLSSDRKIDYRLSGTGWISVRFGFRGWWK